MPGLEATRLSIEESRSDSVGQGEELGKVAQCGPA
jgi:hypothetical protein